ncbi:MAG TPA: hypothetical protein VED85_01870 [Burkholderiaceae bacterium]|nr:hypothetical protein [Burkholderiaceae bacterium]
MSTLVMALMAAALGESLALARAGATAANWPGAVWADIAPSNVIAPVTGAAVGMFVPAVLVRADCSAALLVESAA